MKETAALIELFCKKYSGQNFSITAGEIHALADAVVSSISAKHDEFKFNVESATVKINGRKVRYIDTLEIQHNDDVVRFIAPPFSDVLSRYSPSKTIDRFYNTDNLIKLLCCTDRDYTTVWDALLRLDKHSHIIERFPSIITMAGVITGMQNSLWVEHGVRSSFFPNYPNKLLCIIPMAGVNSGTYNWVYRNNAEHKNLLKVLKMEMPFLFPYLDKHSFALKTYGGSLEIAFDLTPVEK